MTQPSVEDLVPQARERAVVTPDGQWALLPAGMQPVRISGLGDGGDFVPAAAFVDVSRLADDRGRTLAMLNARLHAIGVRDEQVRALLDQAGYDAATAQVVLGLAEAFVPGRLSGPRRDA